MLIWWPFLNICGISLLRQQSLTQQVSLTSTCILLVINMQACTAFLVQMQVNLTGVDHNTCRHGLFHCPVQVNVVCWPRQSKATWSVDHPCPRQHGLQILCNASQRAAFTAAVQDNMVVDHHSHCPSQHDVSVVMRVRHVWQHAVGRKKKVTRAMHHFFDAWCFYMSMFFLFLFLWWVNLYQHESRQIYMYHPYQYTYSMYVWNAYYIWHIRYINYDYIYN